MKETRITCSFQARLDLVIFCISMPWNCGSRRLPVLLFGDRLDPTAYILLHVNKAIPPQKILTTILIPFPVRYAEGLRRIIIYADSYRDLVMIQISYW